MLLVIANGNAFECPFDGSLGILSVILRNDPI